MRELLTDIFDNYSATRARLGGTATIVGSPDQVALLREIPKRIETFFAARQEGFRYVVKGSIGKGNMARVPWIGIFRKDVTETAENGYYVVLLFSEDMSRCYLSLNQGITAIEQRYTRKFAWKKMAEAATAALGFLEVSAELWKGRINLRATADLGRAYESAAIASFEYHRTSLPDDKIFFDHLHQLLGHYNHLFNLFGRDLHSLFSVNEGEFQQVVLEKAAQASGNNTVAKFPITPDIRFGMLSNGPARSPIVAAAAIRSASFLCEIDPNHQTFMSRAKGQQYVEAHHLIPISKQGLFEVSLDVVANIVSLCANCHRRLHYGADQERKSLLRDLLTQRREKLRENMIDVNTADFLGYYSSGLALED